MATVSTQEQSNDAAPADPDDKRALDRVTTYQELTNRGAAMAPSSSWRKTGILAFLSLGVIYGDIGTSPLYVMNAIFSSSGPAPNEEDAIGACSAIIWAITIVALIKYAFIALQVPNKQGEGGPFAVYTSIYPPPQDNEDEDTVLTTYTTASLGAKSTASTLWLQRGWVQSVLFSWVIFGTSLTISDGLLTPAVSVTSAVVGLSIGAGEKVTDSVVGISIAIVVVLFLFQAVGTHRIAVAFAPIVFVWMLILGVCGAINVAERPGVFRAFDPSRAVMLFVRTKNYDLLNGVLLAITGCEALFANLAQFSKASIRLGFAAFCFPCLVLAYLGQTALLVTRGDAIMSNIFFNTIPGGNGNGMWWFTWLFAVLAAVIASQAMITAVFSLIQQLTRLHAIPPIAVVHTSDKASGQVWCPSVNWLMMAGVIGLIAGFGTSAHLTNAYGFAVAGVLIVTTTMIFVYTISKTSLPFIAALAFFLFFGFVDCLFWGASLKKVPMGAWFPLGMALILCSFLLFWSWARGLESRFDLSHRQKLTSVIRRPDNNDDKGEVEEIDSTPTTALGTSGGLRVRMPTKPANDLPSYDASLELAEKSSVKLARLPVFAFFHNLAGNQINGAPHSFAAFLKSYPCLPQVVVFFQIRTTDQPHTTDEERYSISRVRSLEGFYIATFRLGYRDPIDLRDIGRPVRDRIVALESRSTNDPDALLKRVELIDAALESSVTHVLPYLHVSAEKREGTSIFAKAGHYVRAFLLESIYRRVKVNFSEYDSYVMQDESVLRMGVHAPL